MLFGSSSSLAVRQSEKAFTLYKSEVIHQATILMSVDDSKFLFRKDELIFEIESTKFQLQLTSIVHFLANWHYMLTKGSLTHLWASQATPELGKAQPWLVISFCQAQPKPSPSLA